MTKADSPKPPTKLETITLKVFIHCEGCRRKVRRIIRVLDGVEDVTVDSASGKVTVTGTADVKTILQRLQKYGKHAEMWPNPIPALPSAGKAGATQPKPNNNNNGPDSNNKKKSNAGPEGGDKAAAATENGSKKGDGKKEASPIAPAKGEGGAVNENKPEKSKEANPDEASNASTPTQNGGGGGGGGGGKKGGKKGGNGNNATNNGNSNNNGGGGGIVPEVPFPPPPAVHDVPIMNAPNTSIAVSANRSLAPYDSIQTGYTYHSAEYATHMFSDENANNCSIM